MAPPKLSSSEIETRLQDLEDWRLEGDAIKRKLEFDDFLEAIEFINRIATLADSADHHPEIFNVYNRVELLLTTHDSSGLTHKDFDLAQEIDRVI